MVWHLERWKLGALRDIDIGSFVRLLADVSGGCRVTDVIRKRTLYVLFFRDLRESWGVSKLLFLVHLISRKLGKGSWVYQLLLLLQLLLHLNQFLLWDLSKLLFLISIISWIQKLRLLSSCRDLFITLLLLSPGKKARLTTSLILVINHIEISIDPTWVVTKAWWPVSSRTFSTLLSICKHLLFPSFGCFNFVFDRRFLFLFHNFLIHSILMIFFVFLGFIFEELITFTLRSRWLRSSSWRSLDCRWWLLRTLSHGHFSLGFFHWWSILGSSWSHRSWRSLFRLLLSSWSWRSLSFDLFFLGFLLMLLNDLSFEIILILH